MVLFVRNSSLKDKGYSCFLSYCCKKVESEVLALSSILGAYLKSSLAAGFDLVIYTGTLYLSVLGTVVGAFISMHGRERINGLASVFWHDSRA